MFTTVRLFVFLLFVNQINGRRFHSRQTDTLTIMREKCAQNPYAVECTQIKQQMEDLLRKCSNMATPVSACTDVKDKYCFIWPKELYCYTYSGGGGGGQLPPTPSWNNDPNWYQIPSDSTEFRLRGEYCVNHQAEQKCVNLFNTIKSRYVECSNRPATDASCQSFKISLCSAYPKFAPCLNGSSGFKRQVTRLERLFRMRRMLKGNKLNN